MIGWHHSLEGYGFEPAPGVMDREAWRAAFHGAAKSWDMTELLNCVKCVICFLACDMSFMYTE